MQSILISNEANILHYTDFLRCYNYGGLLKINNYYKKYIDSNINKVVFFQDIIRQLEMNSHDIFYKKYGIFEEKDPVNIHFIEPYKKKYIEETDYPIIKLKSINTVVYTSDELPVDFDEMNYRSVHPDLFQITERIVLKKHFIDHGRMEGRMYKPGQKQIIPDYLNKILRNLNIKI